MTYNHKRYSQYLLLRIYIVYSKYNVCSSGAMSCAPLFKGAGLHQYWMEMPSCPRLAALRRAWVMMLVATLAK